MVPSTSDTKDVCRAKTFIFDSFHPWPYQEWISAAPVVLHAISSQKKYTVSHDFSYFCTSVMLQAHLSNPVTILSYAILIMWLHHVILIAKRY